MEKEHSRGKKSKNGYWLHGDIAQPNEQNLKERLMEVKSNMYKESPRISLKEQLICGHPASHKDRPIGHHRRNGCPRSPGARPGQTRDRHYA
jgi:hypothetical protein